jgi:hypothetical protein
VITSALAVLDCFSFRQLQPHERTASDGPLDHDGRAVLVGDLSDERKA